MLDERLIAALGGVLGGLGGLGVFQYLLGRTQATLSDRQSFQADLLKRIKDLEEVADKREERLNALERENGALQADITHLRTNETFLDTEVLRLRGVEAELRVRLARCEDKTA